MAGGGSDNDDGSDIFWPGYVDATTNLILNLLFLLTILIVAVFMFALELGRAVGPQDANADATAVVENPVDEPTLMIVNAELKKEIELLKAQIAAMEEGGAAAAGVAASVEGTLGVEKPAKGLEQLLVGDFEVTVRFPDEAVSFLATEEAKALEELSQVAEKGSAQIYVEVPIGFSESKRLGFYRSLAVRNLLLKLGVPSDMIDVSVVEGAADADASVVKVRSR